MKAKRASELTQSLIVDIDGVLANVQKPVEERHTAAASAMITAVRLLGGLCINVSRIAAALEGIQDGLEDKRAGPRLRDTEEPSGTDKASD